MAQEVTLEVSPEAACVAEARRVAEQHCRALAMAVDCGAIRLLVSELVTNVIRHTPDGHGVMRVRCDSRGCRVEVEDRGPGVPERPASPNRQRGGGFGLFLVDRLSDRWGVRDRNCVWFEIDRISAGPPRRPRRTPARR